MAKEQCICAGALKQPVKIYSTRESVDAGGFGQATATDILVASPIVKVEPQNGREFFRASQVYPTMTHLLTMRYRKGLSTKMKVVLNGRELNIVSIANEQEENRVLHLICMEVPA